MRTLAEQVLADCDHLKSNRSTFEWLWQEVSDYVLPRRDFTVKRSPGQKRTQKIFDGTAPWALEQFAAGLHGLLTSPSLPWFSLLTDDEQLNSDDEVRIWLEDASARMLAVFSSPKIGFNSSVTETYLDLGSLGTSVLFISESNGITFEARPLSESYVREGPTGTVDTLYREFDFTTWQATQYWPDIQVESILQAKEKGDWDKPHTFVHAVTPRALYDPSRPGARNMPWGSYYVHRASKEMVAESGFREFPFIVPRWTKAPGEYYGRSPAMTVLPDIRMVNEMSKDFVRALQKAVDPPLQVPDDGFILPLRTVPAGINYYRSGSQDRIEPLETGSNFQLGFEFLQQRQQAILRGFYTDWLRAPESPNQGERVSATYVMQQRDQRMQILGPMVSRMEPEMLGPIINRTFNIMWRARAFAPPPPQMAGRTLRPYYQSPIASAQRASEAEGVLRLFELMAPIAQVDPSVYQTIKSDELAHFGGRVYNVPTILFRSKDEMQQLQQQEQQRQQTAEQIAGAGGLAAAGKDAATGVKALADANRTTTQPNSQASAAAA